MKTILLCIPTLASAGAERFVTELACNLDMEKFVPIVVVTDSLDTGSAFYVKLVDQGIKVIHIIGSGYPSKVFKLVKLIKHYAPSIIHTNVGAALHLLLPIILSGTKAQHIFTTHSMGYRLFGGLKQRIIKIGFQKKKIIPVAICDTVKRSLVDAYQLKGEDIELVYNGVDTKLFTPENRDKPEFTIVTTGRLCDVKNHILLIEAFYLFHKEVRSAKLIVIGDGELKSELEKEVAQKKLTESVIFTGNQSDVAHFLNAASLYCCTSKVEGLPISVLEAMACGLPVISTPAGGVVDIVRDGTNGMISGWNPQEVANCMMTLYKNKNLRNEMGNASRQIAESLDMRKCAHQYELLYLKYSE